MGKSYCFKEYFLLQVLKDGICPAVLELKHLQSSKRETQSQHNNSAKVIIRLIRVELLTKTIKVQVL